MKISVISTVLNEEAAIGRLLRSLAAQSRLPDEVVIVDGGSTDGTLDALADWSQSEGLALVVLERPGANISEGRNAAIGVASGDVIAATDSGVRLEPDWLETLITPFEQADMYGGPQVAAGWFVADPHTLFEAAMGATVLPTENEISHEMFLPSSRSVAFRKEAWEAVGGYPEWLDYCEDLVFDLRLKALFGAFPFVPEAVAYFRPRGNLRTFFKQYYRYARGDGKADLWRQRHAARYLTYVLAGPLLVALTCFHSPWWCLLLLGGMAVYVARPYRRLWPVLGGYGLVDRLKAVLLVPIIRVTGDVAKMVGYPVGIVWRWKNQHRPELHWRLKARNRQV